MRALILNASPRPQGTTTYLLGEIGKYLNQFAEVESVRVHGLKISPCAGCLKCRPDKSCVLPVDDGHRVAELIRRSEILVMGTPTYWGNVTGPLKTLLDRCVPVFEYIDGWNLRPVQKGKKAVIMTTSSAPYPFNLPGSQAGGAIRAMRTVLHAGGYSILREWNVPGAGCFEKTKGRWTRKILRELESSFRKIRADQSKDPRCGGADRQLKS